MGKMSKRWLPLEANPEVMTKYVNTLGGPDDIEFSDVVACEDWALQTVSKPVYGLVVLFPLNKEMEKAAEDEGEEVEKKGQFVSDKVWFTKQTIGNACGTIGLLHSMYNIQDKAPLQKGKFFSNFFDEVKSKKPEERAKALEESSEIEKAHTDAEREGQSHVPTADEKVDTHFVSFVEVEGNLYELDGRKKFPINHGVCKPDNLLTQAVAVVKEKFMAKTPTELRYSMIAISKKDKAKV
eukprot:GHVS01090563.1.p1 GENE.GHVS01090563.1~~GHVS01090563.1.p1  ORF type:complete len:239 (+),score=37.75 GHVS01090563.1:131-847(+)